MANELTKKICEIFGNNDKGGFQKLVKIFVDTVKFEIKQSKNEFDQEFLINNF